MTSPRVRRTLGRDDRAISSVLGAILLFGLLIVTLVKVRVEFVPVWDHDRESQFMGRVSSELAQIKTDLDRQVANQTSTSISDPIDLGNGGSGFTFFRGAEKNGVITFTPRSAAQGFTIAANPLTIQTRDGVPLQGLQGYLALTNGQTAPSVVAFDTLKLRIDNPVGASNLATLRVDVTSAAGACSGQLILTMGAPPGGATHTNLPRNIEVQTIASYSGPCLASPATVPVHSSDTVFGTCDAPCFAPTTFFFDALDPALVFDQVLASAHDAGPWSVKFTLTGTLAASAVFVYEQAVAGGTNRVGGGGAITPSYSSTLAAGTLTLTKQNQRFPSQSYVMEYGAIVLDQDGRSAMAVPPIFRINTTANQARLNIILPALTGTPNQVGASAAATITSTPQGQRGSLQAQAPAITITLSTAYGPTWVAYWDRIFTQAGFTAGTGYSASSSGTTATLTFSGPVLDGVTNDVFLDLHTGPLALDLRATG
jgi:hypothetical protein